VGWVLDDCNPKWAVGEDRVSQENDGTTGPLYKGISRIAVALAHMGEPPPWEGAQYFVCRNHAQFEDDVPILEILKLSCDFKVSVP
jgi:hypothetical protein